MLGRNDRDRGVIVITDVVRLRNCDGRPLRFAVADADLRDAEIVARERSTAVVALLHSHVTSPPTLSDHDAQAILHARYPWIIVAPAADPDFAFRAYAAGSGERFPVDVYPDLQAMMKALCVPSTVTVTAERAAAQ
jgi:proteasome lid subunit RPN8/RPN11